MEVKDPFVCTGCGGRANYHGRISAPAHMIYKCQDCGDENWIPQLRAQERDEPPGETDKM